MLARSMKLPASAQNNRQLSLVGRILCTFLFFPVFLSFLSCLASLRRFEISLFLLALPIVQIERNNLTTLSRISESP